MGGPNGTHNNEPMAKIRPPRCFEACRKHKSGNEQWMFECDYGNAVIALAATTGSTVACTGLQSCPLQHAPFTNR